MKNGKDDAPIPDLSGKSIAIVAMGNSHAEFITWAASSGSLYELADEVWCVNSMGGVLLHDRVFMLDPPSRFLDTEDAGVMGHGMRKWLPTHPGPIYTCTLDDRVPGAVLYPLKEVCALLETTYFNNTVAYAIAFAIVSKAKRIVLSGADFGYLHIRQFAEAGRACCEYLIGKAENRGICVEVAKQSTLFDSNKPSVERFYGYHRLDDPPVAGLENEKTIILPYSKAKERQQELAHGNVH